jgi:CDP-paratose 2-epimerase
MKLLVTGGCGFIGSRLCTLANAAGITVHAADNLRRLGSERNSTQLQKLGVQVHLTDVRFADEVNRLPKVDAVVLAAAEPTVLAGVGSSPEYTIGSNLVGTLNCLEKARRDNAAVMLLSTSRVYSIDSLRALAHSGASTRFLWDSQGEIEGFDAQRGIAETFSTNGFRSIYGTTKLASELMVNEYHHNYELPTMVLRSGLVAGPGQMARSDQGVIALWVARHCFRQSIRYMGFDGSGRQVRDVLHVDDLCELIMSRLNDLSSWTADIFNVGGGAARSVSLLELTSLCESVTGHQIQITPHRQTSPVDIPIYITDDSKIQRRLNWKPTRDVQTVVRDIHQWIDRGDEALHKVLGK